MIRVTIEITDTDTGYDVKHSVARDGDVLLESLGCTIGMAIAGVINSIEYCEGAELVEGMNTYLPDDLRIETNAVSRPD